MIYKICFLSSGILSLFQLSLTLACLSFKCLRR
nr:MAG TPA: hypothetical protein [Caudoviricetes sp.]